MAGTPAFQVYAAEHPAHPRTLRGRLEAMRAAYMADLIRAQDWPDFQHRRGQIFGLDEAITECVEAEKQRGDD